MQGVLEGVLAYFPHIEHNHIDITARHFISGEVTAEDS